MGRPKERTDMLMPIYWTTAKRWGLTKRSAQVLFGCGAMLYHDFARVMRSEDSTPEEVKRIATAIFEHGQLYNLPGWEELENA